MIDGLAKIQLRHPTGGLFAGGFANVSLESEVNSAQARRYNTAGKNIVSDSRITDTTYTLTLTGEVFDTRSLELAIGETAEITSSINYYDFKEATVPATTPFVINDADLVTGNLSSVMVTLFDNGTYNAGKGQQLAVGTTTPSAMEFVAAAGTLTFNTAQAGAPVIYSFQKTATSKVTVGYESAADNLTSFYFSALIVSDAYPNGAVLVCPSVSKTGGFAFSTEDVPTTENTFELGTPAGFKNPFHIIVL